MRSPAFQDVIGLLAILHTDGVSVAYFVFVCGRQKVGLRLISRRSSRCRQQDPVAQKLEHDRGTAILAVEFCAEYVEVKGFCLFHVGDDQDGRESGVFKRILHEL